MAISDKITSMTNHLTADYDAIESVVGEVTVNKNIENIAPLLDNLWEELPHTTGSGTELTINDTRAGKMKVQPMGNTSQTQKTGKNLLSLPISSSSQFGITVTKNSDGTLTVNGTATADAAVIFNTTVTLAAGTYTLSGCPSGGSSSTYNLNLDQLSTMRDNGSGVTFTLNAERTSTAYVSVKSGVTLNNAIFKPMIVSGSTSGDFEPYTGKKATPNPDNPEQVHIVSGNNTIITTGKNQIGLKSLSSTIISGLTCSVDGDVLTINGTATAKADIQKMLFNLTANTSKTLKFYLESGTFTAGNIGIHLNENEESGQVSFIQIPYDTASLKSTKTISLTNVNYVWVYATSGSVFNNAKFKIMLSDDVNDDYEPYQSTSYPINLPVENIFNELATQNQKTGITISTDRRSVVVDFSAGNDMYFFISKDFESPTAKTYTISFEVSGIASGEQPRFNLWGGGTYFTLKNGRNVCVIPSGTTLNQNAILWDDQARTQYPVSSVLTFTNFMIVDGEYTEQTMPSYTPYGTTPIWLGEISTYKDGFFKAVTGNSIYDNLDSATKETLDYGEWYLKHEIGKVVLNGSEYWIDEGGGAPYALNLDNFYKNNSMSTVMSNYYYGTYWDANWNNYSYLVSANTAASNIDRVKFKNVDISSLADWKTWLGTHNTTIYYIQKTPTYTKITDSTLLTQLENVWRANSYKGTTNIIQINNDLPFELSITALEG